ncbi:MAG: chloride channel protein, partial [Actinobacteria bacterium]|nr:chloride channel protein [Actinomycetota bacterium]
MQPPDEQPIDLSQDDDNMADERQVLLGLTVLALVGGALVGLIGSAFRWLLAEGDQTRINLVDWAQRWPVLGILIPVFTAAVCVLIARAMVVKVPEASGSGVQRVEAAMKGEIEPESVRILPVKFVGGILGISAGMVLGREGPLVQMGASIGSKLGRTLGLNRLSSYSLEASLAGAGLAVAFNAPTGGSIFVFEELTKSFRLRLVIPTLVGTATAITISRWILGDDPSFIVGDLAAYSAFAFLAFAVFGVIVGFLGAFYNVTVVWFMDTFDAIKRIPLLVKAAIVGAFIGGIAWFAPTLVGGGDTITQQMISASPGLWAVLGILVVRWILGPLSYSVGTPGGLFAPLLALGALCGAIFAGSINALMPGTLNVTA